jgi:hypothetical protein
MVKITMTSGTIFYKDETWQSFKAWVNSANARGASCTTAFKEQTLVTEVVIQLQNVEYFETLDTTDPIDDTVYVDNPPTPPVT